MSDTTPATQPTRAGEPICSICSSTVLVEKQKVWTAGPLHLRPPDRWLCRSCLKQGKS